MNTVLIAGGTGMIGQALTHALMKKGYHVVILTRGKNRSEEGIDYAHWDPEQGIVPGEQFARADAVVNLAGVNLAEKRWTSKRKKLIVESRVKSGEAIVNAIQSNPANIRCVISSSAIGWYGPDPVIPNPKPFVESDPAANNFLSDTCKSWETAIAPVRELGKRLVIFRTGIVLSNAGGAYKEFRFPFRFHVAPVLGNGKQVYSWIHIDDLVQLYIRAIEDETMDGIYNAVAPEAVSNKQLMKTIAAVTKIKSVFMPVPSLALKIALGELSIEVLKSATVSSQKLLQAGFLFNHPSVESAIHELESR